jgi:hypothetical protein
MVTLTKKRLVKKEMPLYQKLGERLAEIKKVVKSLEEEGAIIQKELLGNNDVRDKIETSFGVLVLRERENWELVNKDTVIKVLGMDEYVLRSSISKTGVIASVGETGFNNIVKKGGFLKKESTQFYQLNKA